MDESTLWFGMLPLRACVVRPFSFVMLPSLFFFVLFVPFAVNSLSYLVAAKGCSKAFVVISLFYFVAASGCSG